MQALVADTCLAIWMVRDAPISASGLAALEEAAERRRPILVSPITAWEIGLLVSRGRLSLGITPEQWFLRLPAFPGVRLAAMPPSLLIASSFLPGAPPKDPADRIIAATARDLGATLLTRDELLLAYAEQGHLQAVAC